MREIFEEGKVLEFFISQIFLGVLVILMRTLLSIKKK